MNNETLIEALTRTTYYVWATRPFTDENGRIVQDVFRTLENPNHMDEAEIASLQSIARVIHTSPREKTEFPNAPRYTVHIPGEMSRKEINSLRVSINQIVPS